MAINSFSKNAFSNGVTVKTESFNWSEDFEFPLKDAQYNSLWMGTGLKLISEKGIIELRGADALDYLHRISTNSLKDLEKNFYTTTIFTNEKGRVIDRVGVINAGDALILLGSPQNQVKTSGWIRKYIIQDDVSVNDYDGRYVFFSLEGPQADSFIRILVGNDINKIEINQCREFFVEDIHLFILKLKDAFDNFKYIVFASPAYAKKMIQFMLENKGVFDFSLVQDDVYDVYRVECGIPKAPNELNDFYNPLELNLANDVCFSKGCYVGQEVIARLQTYDKVQNTLCGVVFNEPINDINAEFTLYDRNDEACGDVTSIVINPVTNKTIGLAVVKRSCFANGAKLKAGSKNCSTYVELTKLPFKK